MKHVDSIIAARWILPVRPENRVLENYALVINDGVIVDLLAQSEVDKVYTANEVFQRDNHVLMPGLINAHTHLGMSYYRGLKDDVTLHTWLSDYIWPAERKTISAEYVYDATIHALAECIRGGVTCVNDHYFHMDEVAKACSNAGVRGVLSHCIYHFQTPWAKTPDECFSHQEKLIELLKDSQLLSVAIGPHSPYGVNDEIMQKVYQLSSQNNLPIHTHLHETQHEVDEFVSIYGQSPVKHYASKGWLSDRFIAVHMTALDEEEIELLVENNVNVVHCPESNMKLSSGISPVQKMLNRGINVALGTDGSASNNDIDMISEMRSASFLAKVANLNPEDLSAEAVLEMATIAGAKALKLDEAVGSLEIGKRADCISVDLLFPETLPVYHPISQIVYAASRNQVNDTWVNGQCLMKDRALLTIDEQQLYQKQLNWHEKIQSAVKS
ncbi:TRZ/ATZ family hydrolase [Thiotrichales bacterium 19S3-7]|nr:TRZ/ATZ family hydrolase [Thiotrichales bacterium 19S3-7]MCF6801451.1 TRZ/ATZ family hydrolase [Thiotrichales bacterium 19S3-11]